MGGTRLQENGRMNWLEQVHQMKDRDIRTIEQHELQGHIDDLPGLVHHQIDAGL